MTQLGAKPNQQLIEQAAQQIGRWRLTQPAIAFLEIIKPFSFLASQGLLLCQPFLGFFVEGPRIADYAELLADRANVDRLVTRLERSQPDRINEPKEANG